MTDESPTFFPTPADFRAWLERHGASEDHLWVGYYKKATGKPSVEDSGKGLRIKQLRRG